MSLWLIEYFQRVFVLLLGHGVVVEGGVVFREGDAPAFDRVSDDGRRPVLHFPRLVHSLQDFRDGVTVYLQGVPAERLEFFRVRPGIVTARCERVTEDGPEVGKIGGGGRVKIEDIAGRSTINVPINE